MAKLMSVWLIELIVNLYDILTLPIYFLIQKPWKAREEATKIRARLVDDFTWVNIESQLEKSSRKAVSTLDQLFRDSVSTYATKNCLGVRRILAVEYKNESRISSNGIAGKQIQNGSTGGDTIGSPPIVAVQAINKTISKYVLDDKYTWHTYQEIEKIVVKLSTGLIRSCSESLKNSDESSKLLICADTCMEWFLLAHACFRNNITVVTAYTSLDDDAILHSIHQTEVKILVVCQKFINRVPKLVKESPLVDTIIVLDKPLPDEIDGIVLLKELLGNSNVKRVLSYEDLVSLGADGKENISSVPTGDDVAVLMYTSGSTGQPKGVMLTHKSIVYTALSFSGPGDISHEDRYIGYLPLGHVLELAAECIFLRNGSTIAYSSPMTLTNGSPMIRKDQFGDAYIFKPTIMGAVPLVLDRIKTGVQQKIKSQGTFYDQLINDFVVRYKRYWWERYYSTPIMNTLICSKFNDVLGGKIRAICSGGAALSRDTQEYLRHVTNYTVLQGYGLTETSAAASFCNVNDRRYNVVGPPYPIVRIRLESWSDYSVHDKPYPRGEVIIGGQPVSAGYYKNTELTEESFFIDPKSGMRFFRTGDVGMMLPDGVLKIIDRKKDIVKPLSGEYISLSEIESVMRTVPIVENICVYCSQYSNYLVAIVKSDLKELKIQAQQLFTESGEMGNKFRRSMQKYHDLVNYDRNDDSIDVLDNIQHDVVCSNKWFNERILKLLQQEGAKRKLKRTQIPSKIKLAIEEWTPESGLVSASFKLRRREIERHYAEDIKQMYEDLGQKIDQD